MSYRSVGINMTHESPLRCPAHPTRNGLTVDVMLPNGERFVWVMEPGRISESRVQGVRGRGRGVDE